MGTLIALIIGIVVTPVTLGWAAGRVTQDPVVGVLVAIGVFWGLVVLAPYAPNNLPRKH